jgi:hypothetical protein
MISETIGSSVGIWTIIGPIGGVIIGLMLGEGLRIVRESIRIGKLKKMIRKELESIKAMIPQKKSIVQQMLNALNKKKILPGISVGIINIGYRSHIHELYEHLSFKERECLHVIYEILAISDDVLKSFDLEITDDIFKSEMLGKTWLDFEKKYNARLRETLTSYDKVENLIEGYLEGRIPNVLPRLNIPKQE